MTVKKGDLVFPTDNEIVSEWEREAKKIKKLAKAEVVHATDNQCSA